MNRRRVPSPRGNARDWAPRAVALFARSALALCCAGLIVAMPAVHASSNVTSPATASPVSLAELLAPKPATQPGQSATQLADGRWLLLGGGTGSSISRAAVVLDAAGASMALGATMTQARSGQAATLMPDGRVLVLGGLGRDGSIVDTAEIFDPASGTFTTAGSLGLLARTEQSATVLADGRLLIAGGVDGKGFAVQDVELLDPVSGQLERLGTPLDAARLQHVAALLPDTNVLLWGGSDPQGQALGSGDLFNSTAQTFSATTADASRALAASLTGTAPPALLDSIPAASATQVPVTQRLMLRLSKRMSVASLNATTVTLVGPEGPVKINPVAVDGGVLLFVTPQQQLLPDSAFTLFVQGATDEYGQPLPMVAVGFRTAALGGTTSTARGTATASVVASPATAAATLKSAAGAAAPASAAAIAGAGDDDDTWTPSEANYHGDWRSGRRLLAGRTPPLNAQLRWALHGDPQLLKLTPRQAAMGQLPPLPQGPAGITAVVGQTLKLNGRPLAGVTVSIGGRAARTDGNGEFVLTGVPAGHQVLVIDGASADKGNRHYGRYEYGMTVTAGKTTVLPFVSWMTPLDTADTVNVPSPTTAPVVLTNPKIPGLELRIPAGTVIRDSEGRIVTQISMTAIPVDQPPFPLPNFPVPVYFTVQPGGSHLTGIDAKSTQGAQLVYPNFSHAPAGTRMTFWDYDATSRGWFMYGQGTVTADGSQVMPDPGVVIYEFSGAMIASPGSAPGAGAPGGSGAPGDGSDGGGSGNGADGGGGPGGDGGGPGGDGGDGGAGPGDGGGSSSGGGASGACSVPGGGTGTGGDPVDLFTGLFTYGRTDLSIQDVIPISVSRTYRQADDTSRAFGIGTNLSYDLFLVGDVFPYTYQYLILPNGGHVYFPRISTGTSYGDAVYQAQACPGSVFYGAIMRWDTSVPHSSWSLTLKSGTIYYFPDSYMATNARVAAAIMIRDRHGNTVTLNRDGNGNLTQIVSPNGRQITLTYDGSNRIHQATDDLGRLVTYDYDAAGRLQKVTDPMGFAEQYAYQTQLVVPTQSIGGVSSTTNLTQVTDRRGNPKITNTYDGNGRVIKQVYADGTFDTFAYTIHSIPAPATVMVPGGGGNAGTNVGVVTQVDSMNERGTTTRRLFDANGYVISLTRALGLPEQQTHTYVRDPATSLVTSETDSLGRTTAYQYDAVGNITKITRLYGTPNAVSSTMTYDPTYNQLTSVTDPNNNTTTLTYDAYGNLTQATDALGHSVKTVYDAEGRPTSIQDALSHVRSLSYQGADLASTTDPLGNTVRYFADQVGRTTSVIDPMGNASYLAYDNLDRVRQATDAKGNVTSKTYDQNGNVLTLVDQNLNTTSFSYDSRNRVAGSKDALLQASTQSYEPGGRVSQVIDRNGQVSGVTQFDGLGRPLQQGFGATTAAPTVFKSTVTNTWDAGNRLTKVVDSASGTITRTYDDLDRLKSETSPQGTVSYTYDAGGRRQTMTVQGQPTVTYTWDKGNRLIQIQQAAGPINGNAIKTIKFSYDNADRRTQTTLPNGIVVAYAYDNADELTGITYKKSSGTVIGNLTYTYDADGHRTSVGGTLANVNPGVPASSTSFDADNRLTTWNGQALAYDRNGNLINDGSNTYTWDERNRLIAMNGASTASFAYDSFGRRTSATVGGAATSYLYDGMNAAQTQSGATTSSLLSGLGIDELYATLSATQQAYRLADALGSTIALTDATQAPAAIYAYDAYGNSTRSGAGNSPVQYTGRENDGDGLYFYRARYYSSRFARFVSVDPLGWEAGQSNYYSYVEGDPVLFSDPAGLNKLDPFYGLSKAFWNWLHSVDGGKLINSLKDGKNVPEDVAREMHQEWLDAGKPNPRDGQTGAVDPDLLEGFLPWWLTPSPLGAAPCEMPGGPACGVPLPHCP